jgi:hypothetical protein
MAWHPRRRHSSQQKYVFHLPYYYWDVFSVELLYGPKINSKQANLNTSTRSSEVILWAQNPIFQHRLHQNPPLDTSLCKFHLSPILSTYLSTTHNAVILHIFLVLQKATFEEISLPQFHTLPSSSFSLTVLLLSPSRSIQMDFHTLTVLICISPLWSSGQTSWLQTQRSGFDSRRCQIFWVAVGLERGSTQPLWG